MLYLWLHRLKRLAIIDNFMRTFLIGFLTLFAIGNSYAAAHQDLSCPDSLRVYYDKYFKDPTDPIVLTASDTLFEMAQLCKDTLMQKLALGSKVDYYYYGRVENRTDSIILWVNKIKEYASKIGNEEFYYWAWSARLINHYLRMGEYNIALIEAGKMLKEAEVSKYKENIADCYSSLANIYGAKGLMGKSQEFMLKEIDLYEKYDLKRLNISFQYSDAAKIYLDEGEIKPALPLLKKAMETANTPYHEVTAKLCYVAYYLAINDMQAAHQELEECREMYNKEPSIRRHIHYFYDAETNYYRKTGNYEAALNSLELRTQELQNKNELVALAELDKTKADIYWDMGKKDKAAELYKNYLEYQKKERERSEEITTSEFATLLNIQQLTAENRELERIAQEKKLHNIQLTTVFLVLLLIIVIFFLYYQRKLNSKLKKSRNKLDEQNRILIAAEEELVRAKEVAEKSSWMKTLFIQNMSHEIRTPLNSIVGFSAVLADLFSDNNEEVKQYAGLIDDNSKLLLKLITDILDISNLDNDPEIEITPTDVNGCCALAMDETRTLFKENVKVNFRQTCDELVINSNTERITQVLRNLLNNASKFTREGSVELTYSVDNTDKMIIFTVTDTGIGIPPNQSERIFERFVKLDDFSQGTGLGLSICRIIAEKLGGYLVVDETYTQGARFVFAISM